MKKIASPQDLQAELRRILAYSEGHQPLRAVLAAELHTLADRVAASDKELAGDAKDLVDDAGSMIRRLQVLTKEAKGKGELAAHLKGAMKAMVDADRALRLIAAQLKG